MENPYAGDLSLTGPWDHEGDLPGVTAEGVREVR